MPTVRLQDVINVKVYQDIPAEDSPEKIALFESGIIDQNPALDELANAAGIVAELPFWRDIDSATEPNISNDDPTNKAAPAKIVQGSMMTRKAMLNKGLSAMDLTRELAMGDDAMRHIKNRIEAYWWRQLQRRIIASAVGVLASNQANGGSDMVHDVAAATNSGVGAGTVFTRGNFTSAVFTLGDAWDSIAAIGVHSVVLKRMVDSGDIVYIRPFEGSLDVPTYLGKRVIVDDGLPVTPAAGINQGDAAAKYTSILFGAGAFGFGDGVPATPVAIQRNESGGNGAGEEQFWTRKTWIIHPYGFKIKDADTPGADVSFSNAELRAAARWERVFDRKNVPLAFLVTNG